MKLFKANKGLHIPGRKEDTTYSQTESFITPEFIYIPLSIKGTDFDVYVKPGDHVLVGQVIARRTEEKGLPLVLHSSISGEVIGNERKMHQSGLPYVSVKIKNDFKDTTAFTTPVTNIDDMTKEQLLAIMNESGIVGLGGAGFPTYLKYRNVKNIDTVILNGAECEPYITADYRLMIENTEKIMDGLTIMMKIANAPKGIIAIKQGKKAIYDKLVAAAKKAKSIKVVLVPDEYPAGWERQIVYRTVHRSYDKFPFECGVIVNNVSTAGALSDAVRLGKPVIERIVTVAGQGIVNPKNILVRIGTLASDLIKLCGGIAEDLGDVRIIAGGPMMGVSQKSDDFVVGSALSAVTILPGEHHYETPHDKPVGDVLLDVLHFTEHDPFHFVRDEQPCVRCGNCVTYCPAGLQPTLLRTASNAKDEALLKKLDVNSCISCGTCAYVCPSHIKVNEDIKKGKTYYANKTRNKK